MVEEKQQTWRINDQQNQLLFPEREREGARAASRTIGCNKFKFKLSAPKLNVNSNYSNHSPVRHNPFLVPGMRLHSLCQYFALQAGKAEEIIPVLRHDQSPSRPAATWQKMKLRGGPS